MSLRVYRSVGAVGRAVLRPEPGPTPDRKDHSLPAFVGQQHSGMERRNQPVRSILHCLSWLLIFILKVTKCRENFPSRLDLVFMHL